MPDSFACIPMTISPLAGKPAPPELLVNVPRLVTAYYSGRPDPAEPAQRVAFGTSGHRGSAFDLSFNEAHVLAISEAVCRYRAGKDINGPLFVGIDTHALSEPACASVLEILAQNRVQVMLAQRGEYTPTPAVSHAILCHNRGRSQGLADGIVITPSHNPPGDGGIKYNPPHGGPAGTEVTAWIEKTANEILSEGVTRLPRMPYAKALRAETTHFHDYLGAYVEDLGNVVDMLAIRDAGIRMAVDPMGGAGVNYWARIGERYALALDILNREVDPTFRFMLVDADGKIRMDPASPCVMRGLVEFKQDYNVIFACDTDHDRHGIITPFAGLLPANHYLAVAIDYLFRNRPAWARTAGIGKTVVSSGIIDRVAAGLARSLYEVPVGFKWFVDGLHGGALGFGGEESAGASFLRRDGTVWTTDKDGMTAALLSAEITAVSGRDPGEYYSALTAQYGNPVSDRHEAPANPAQKRALASLSAKQITARELAGDPITSILTEAPGNSAPIGGIKVATDNGWFAARPSGTEDIYKIYGESFRDKEHLQRIIAEAQSLVDSVIHTA